MKTKKIFLFIYLFFFPITISAYQRSQLSSTILGNFPITSSPAYGVSNYNITQSVKYNVEINFTLTQKSGSGNYFFKFARLDNRMPNSTKSKYTPPYQESDLLYNTITGYSALNMGHNDQFNNTFDSFNATLGTDETVTLSQHYIIGLNAINFHDVDIADIGTYNISDEIFDLYCNNTEPYYERDDPDLILLSNNIVGPTNLTVIDKAEKIYDWVSTELEYNGGLPAQEKGAVWANDNLEGDCSEYSSLMITLLRIQGIPARKVTGFLVSNNPALRPQVGNSWSFHASELSDNMLGHAWVEYYVPNIGWIATDPTWWEANYFNRIDFLRFNLNVGANFFFPPNYTESEFINPAFYSGGGSFTYNYDIDLTVIESNLLPLEQFPILFLVFVGIGVSAVLITLILIIKRSRKKNFYE
jgi:hypothetical protein